MRVFIIGFQHFPRGDAGANYLQYFALALIAAGYEVVVVGKKESGRKSTELEEKEYKGIRYVNMPGGQSRFQNMTYDKEFFERLDGKYGFSAEDIYIFYCANYPLFRCFINKKKYDRTYFIRVEDLQPEQFKLGRFNPKYCAERMSIRYAQKHMKGTIPISQRLADQDSKYNQNVFRLPIMADTTEYPYNKPLPTTQNISFVYPGLKVTGLEDDFISMFHALNALSVEEKKKISVHITGVNKEKIFQVIDESILKGLNDVLIFHGFIEYSELVKVYINSDFLLLPRKINNITKANFPSKIPEMMAFGIIPICTDVGDYTELYLDEKNSIIMSGTGITPCINGLRKAINMPPHERIVMRNNARKLVEDVFDYRNWVDRIYSFLQGSLEND